MQAEAMAVGRFKRDEDISEVEFVKCLREGVRMISAVAKGE